MAKSEVISKIQSFYERENRVPVSKDYRAAYGGSGLPHWQTLKKHFPRQTYDEIIHQALGFQTFRQLFSEFVLQRNRAVIFAQSKDIVPEGHWASQISFTRWLNAQCGRTINGYYVRLYTGGTRAHGYIFQFTKIESLIRQEAPA